MDYVVKVGHTFLILIDPGVNKHLDNENQVGFVQAQSACVYRMFKRCLLKHEQRRLCSNQFMSPVNSVCGFAA